MSDHFDMAHPLKNLRRFDASFEQRRLRALAFGVFGAALVWQIVTMNLAPHLIDLAPRAALFLAPAHPTILLELADRKVNPGDEWSDSLRPTDDQRQNAATTEGLDQGVREAINSAAERDEARAWAETALTQSPLDARALRLLGQLAPESSTAAFMEAAARHSQNETRAHHWLLQDRFEQRRYADVMRIADLLLRTRPQLLETVTPFLARMAEDRAAVDELERALARNPPWRDRFFAVLPKAVTDARAPFRLMLSLKNTPFPARAESQSAYLAFLFRNHAYDFAHYVWRQLLPPERSRTADLIYNGGFDLPLSGLPFDWSIASGSGVTIDIVPRPGNDKLRALMIDYGQGRASPHSVVEFVKLTAGAYRMIGRYRGELIGRRGVRWQIACVETRTTIGESEMAMGRIPDWKRFEFEFVVPAEGCPLQFVQLDLAARSPSEWMVSGRMWYAALKIEPVDVTTPSSR